MSGAAPQAGRATRSLAERLGLFGAGDAVLVRRLLAALLVVYSVSFVAFYPQIATNDDESMYISQARLVLAGKPTITQYDPIRDVPLEVYPSTYAPGTAMVMAPFVELFGWRAAFVVPWLALLAATWLTYRWIREAGHEPLLALIVFGFPPSLVMGRVAMSDVPSAAIAALGLLLFWKGQDRHPGWWIASGLVAGASWAFRATNPILFVPLFAGTVLRRERKCWALIVGGLAGLGIRFLAMQAYFGAALYERSAYHLALDSIMDRLPIYLIGLMIFAPAGLLFGVLYRGRRRPEIVGTIVLIFLFFLGQFYSTHGTSFVKRLVLALRYFIPLLPVLAFAMSESVPRTLAALRARPGSGPRLAAAIGVAGVLWVGAVGVAAAAVHPAFSWWSATQAQMREVIDEHLPRDGVFVTNWMATRKFMPLFEQKYRQVDRDLVTPRDVQELTRRHGAIYVVLVNRSDSEHWRRDGERTAQFLASLRNEPALLVDRSPTATDRIRIWRLDRDSPRKQR